MPSPDQTQQQPKAGGGDVRSDSLLPTDAQADDGRFDVAAEVNLDQQSDTARRVGQAPEGSAADALAKTLKDTAATQDAGRGKQTGA